MTFYELILQSKQYHFCLTLLVKEFTIQIQEGRAQGLPLDGRRVKKWEGL